MDHAVKFDTLYNDTTFLNSHIYNEIHHPQQLHHAQVEYKGTGRRKNSVARVRLVPGEGNMTVNGRDVRDYLPFESLILDINQAFDVTETKGNYDVLVNVHGGGFTGQAQAIRHGISRALLEADPEYRSSLKRAGLLTRDPRMKERKKPGLKKARRSPQFSKR